MGKIYESGLLQVWVKQWWPKQTFCSGSLVTQARTLNLMDVQSSFYVLAVGLGLAGVVLAAESGVTILRHRLRSSMWAQDNTGTARGRLGRLLFWGCIGRDGSASRGPCDGKQTSTVERRENGCQNARRPSEFKGHNGGQFGANLGNHKASERYETHNNYGLTFKDIYYNRGYSDDSTEFQNGTDRTPNTKHTTSDFTNVSPLPHDQALINGFVNKRNKDKKSTKRKENTKESFEIEVHDNQA